MNSSTTCLSHPDIQNLLSGELTPAEISFVEQHVCHCESCRMALEHGVASPEWWRHVGESLKSTHADASYHRDEPTRIAQLLKLLGPTDDPDSLGRIGSYEIAGLLGQGGMGAVFKAFDAGLNRYVAIKILLPHLAASADSRRRFAREGQAAAAVVDDHVLPIYAVSEWQGTPYLVAKYTRGISLQQRLEKDGPLAVNEVLRIGMQTARGLVAAHAQGLVHRDIKPSNILLDGQVDRALLTDFGLARAADDVSMTRTGAVAGTPQYMSPEQARAEIADQRSDLFSLGSVLYAICTGVAPFRAESSLAVLRLVTDGQPEPIQSLNPDVPSWLCAIIRRLMSRNPDDRFQTASEVAELLQDCLAHIQHPQAAPLPSAICEPCHARTGQVLRNYAPLILITFACTVVAAIAMLASGTQDDPAEPIAKTTTSASTPPTANATNNSADLLEARKALQACQSSLEWLRHVEMKVSWNYTRPDVGRVENTDHIRRDDEKLLIHRTLSYPDKPPAFPGNSTHLFLDDGEAHFTRTTSVGQKKLTGGVTVRDRAEQRWKMMESTGNFALEGYCWGNQGRTLMELLLEAKQLQVAREKVEDNNCLRISDRNDWGTLTVWIDANSARRLRKIELHKERGHIYSTSRLGQHRDTTSYESFTVRADKIRYETINGTSVATSGRVQFRQHLNGRKGRELAYSFKRSAIHLAPDLSSPDIFKPDFDDGARVSDWDSFDRREAFRWTDGQLVRE